MNEDRQSFSFKPMTLYSFFPKNKRLKLAKKDSKISSKLKKQNNNLFDNTLNKKGKSMKWSSKNNNYDYNYNFSPTLNNKQNNFVNTASSTSNNFYRNSMNQNSNSNNNYITRKHSMNYRREKKGSSDFNFNGLNNINNFESKETNEKY